MNNVIGIISLSKKPKGIISKELVKTDRGYFFEFKVGIENPMIEINTVPKTKNASCLCPKKIQP